MHYPANMTAELEAALPYCLLKDRVHLGHHLKKLRGQLSQRNNHNVGHDLDRIRKHIANSRNLRDRRLQSIPKVSYPQELPIAARTDEIREAIGKHQVVVVAGETGSGKTTQLPKICLEAGRGRDGRIVCTQPRRIAALALSQRLAKELSVTWGQEVGCKIRFRDQTAAETLVKLVTDGMLLSEMRGDRELLEYDTIILDEAHERSLNIDFLLGYLRLLLKKRPDLKLIITSATIDVEKFSEAFRGAPIIEVSGRMFPVEVRYLTLEKLLGDAEEYSYIDAAVTAVQQLIDESGHSSGDVLIFMPGERDIRETSDLLQSRLSGEHFEILPLFSRLTTAEQQRVFTPADRRRVVVATNVAETSLTIPGIRYVVDPGLARINRYNPRTHTQRLPIEPISRGSAEQRKGRCGRVAKGVCIRLYSEEDFLSRSEYAAPEIQRSDLADVILRMIDLQLGKVEKFPFIDPPTPRAIKSGYTQLQELGALDEKRQLTRLGRNMAQMPIAPTVSRMILQAQAEKALPEVLVIASAISIQDPRERPLEKRDEADSMHKQFANRHSDFLTMLNIWNRYHERFAQLKTQNQMRKFCRSHFLSFTRMREWQDIHTQLIDVLKDLGGFCLQNPDNLRASHDAIHRSIVTGLLSNIANKKEHNLYKAAYNREVMVFPGSGLFERRQEPEDHDRGKEKAVPDKSQSPEWIVAAEIVETSRLFARIAARIRSNWLPELGSHLCRKSYGNPYWSRRTGRVLVQETVRLHGLQVANQSVPFRQLNPREAVEIFIRQALLTGDVDTPYGFLEYNRQLVDRIETWQTRTRRTDAVDLEATAYRFYAERIEENVSAIHDLNRIINARDTGDRFLYMKETDLLAESESELDRDAFPDQVDLQGEGVKLAYAYKPGQENDGVTIRLPYRLVDAVSPDILDWLVPGMREEKITLLLRSLPKQLRKLLLPIPQTARTIASELKPTHPSFLEALEKHLVDRYRLKVRRSDWKPDVIPEHLRMRIEVHGTDGSTVAAGRNLSRLSNQLQKHDTPAEQDAWAKMAVRWEHKSLKSWVFDDLPAQVEVTSVSGIPLLGYPGLECSAEAVDLKLFKKRTDAENATSSGVVRLAELVMKDQMLWLRRELKGLRQLETLYAAFGSSANLQQQAYSCIVRYLFLHKPALPLSRTAFEARCEDGRKKMAAVTEQMFDKLKTLLELRHQLIANPAPYPGMNEDLNRLLPTGFVSATEFDRFSHLCRYVRAIAVRNDRARGDAGRDYQKAKQIAPYQSVLNNLETELYNSDGRRSQLIQEFHWMLEEFRISVFAQELGTAEKISAKRLNKKLEEIERL